MKTTLVLIALVLCSCIPAAYPVDAPNPLDEPGSRQPTQAELHRKNLRAITFNPTF